MAAIDGRPAQAEQAAAVTTSTYHENYILHRAALKMEAYTVSESVRGQGQAINQQKTAGGIVNNLIDEPQISYQGYKRTDNPEDYTTYSWRATAGATLRF